MSTGTRPVPVMVTRTSQPSSPALATAATWASPRCSRNTVVASHARIAGDGSPGPGERAAAVVGPRRRQWAAEQGRVVRGAVEEVEHRLQTRR